MKMYRDGTTVGELNRIEEERFYKNMNEHFLEWKPLKYKQSMCRNYKHWTIEQRQKQAEVFKYFLNHPNETYASIERKFWCKKNYVHYLLNRYPKLKMKLIENREKEILNMYEDVLYDIAEITARNVKAYKESDQQLRTNELKDLSSIAKDTNERKNLIEGKPTENQNITINIS